MRRRARVRKTVSHSLHEETAGGGSPPVRGRGAAGGGRYGIVFEPTFDTALSEPSLAKAVIPKYHVPEERFDTR